MGFDWKIAGAKALRDFVITCLAVGGVAVTSYFSIPEHIAPILGVLPDTVQHALIPLASSFFVFAHNWINNRNGASQ